MIEVDQYCQEGRVVAGYPQRPLLLLLLSLLLLLLSSYTSPLGSILVVV